MGNQLSSVSNGDVSTDKITEMALKLDLYAQRIITKEVKFNSALSDSGKCDKLIIITSEILNRLPFRLISYMDRRHALFSEKYETFNSTDKALILNTNPEILKESRLDEPSDFRKKQMCVGIARFYIQIGNLFNAVMSTMRPYNYENDRRTAPDNFYDMLTNSLFEKEDTSSIKNQQSNLSSFIKRQRETSNKLNRFLKEGQDMEITPSVCGVQAAIMNKKSTPLSMNSTSTSRAKVEPSIFAALDELYYDVFHEKSITNPKSPQFIEMSKTMREQIYLKDVRELYKIVTGKDASDDINTFSDISKHIGSRFNSWCSQNPDKTFKVTDNVRRNDSFIKYVKHIIDMSREIARKRSNIIRLLDNVFLIQKKSRDEIYHNEENWEKGFKRIDGFDMTDEYSREFYRLNMAHDFFIRPNLTDAELQNIINKARKQIVSLYAESHKRFYEGVQLLQVIRAELEMSVSENRSNISKQQQEINKEYNPRDEGEKLYNKLANEVNSDVANEYNKVYNEMQDSVVKNDNIDTRGALSLIQNKLNGSIEREIQRYRGNWTEEHISLIKQIIKQYQKQSDTYIKPQTQVAAQQMVVS
jgi:hypothetical protein